jgi:hypothetical protein
LEERDPESSSISRHNCGQCPASYATIKSLKQHAMSHTKEVKKHSCVVCNKKFQFVQELNIHLVSAHTDGVRVLERPLGAGNQREEVVAGPESRSEVVAEPESDLSCKECSKTFATPVRLQLHHDKFHGKDGSVLTVKEKLKCGVCAIVFMTKQGLDKHRCKQSVFHTCPHCNLCFTKESYLGDHIKEEHSREQVLEGAI